jgi:hypothetical protein
MSDDKEVSVYSGPMTRETGYRLEVRGPLTARGFRNLIAQLSLYASFLDEDERAEIAGPAASGPVPETTS